MLTPVKSASTPIEGGLPSKATDKKAINRPGKQPYEPNETPQSSKYPLNPEAPEYCHTPIPNQEGLPYDIKIDSYQDASFVCLMETQDRHNEALMQLVRHQQQSAAALTLLQPSMQVFSSVPIDYCTSYTRSNTKKQCKHLNRSNCDRKLNWKPRHKRGATAH